MKKIKSLPENLINQIAAGEMIERPASIIKELVENAIDAGANKIEVKINGGGINQISIIDNGEGIAKDDLPLALIRHATSKISSFADLVQIQTMGFRGEALASIASAAHLQIISATENSPAFSIEVDGGKVSQITPATRERGTSIIVRDLFFNIPARRQFLKTEATENAHCLEACKRIALVNPSVEFIVRNTNNNRVNWQLPAQKNDNDHQRIKALLGDEFINHSRAFSETTLIVDAPASVSGVLNLPSSTNTLQKDCQYIFVNNRFVRDRVILHAVREGYAELKHDAKNLAFVLFLELPPAEVDVNVSPHKTEVRFRKSQIIHGIVRQSVRKALAGVPGQYSMPIMNGLGGALADGANNKPFDGSASFLDNNQNSQYKNIGADFAKGSGKVSGQGSNFQKSYQSYLPSTEQNNFAQEILNINNNGDSVNQSDISSDAQPLGFAIGMLHNLYILAQNNEGMIIVEVHAAHERLLFEKLKLGKHKNNSQNLIVPWRIYLDDVQIEIFNVYKEFFEEHGIFGEMNIESEKSVLIISAVPQIISKTDYQQLVIQVLAELALHGNSQSITEVSEQVLATMACHGAMRGRQTLTLEQMNALLREMEQYERSGSCNHGRPTYASIPINDFDNFFMRGK